MGSCNGSGLVYDTASDPQEMRSREVPQVVSMRLRRVAPGGSYTVHTTQPPGRKAYSERLDRGGLHNTAKLSGRGGRSQGQRKDPGLYQAWGRSSSAHWRERPSRTVDKHRSVPWKFFVYEAQNPSLIPT